MKIKKYIEKIVDNGDRNDMDQLSVIFERAMCDLEKYDYDSYKKNKDDLYCLAYGPVISEDMVEELIEKIGQHWDYDETEQVRNQYGYFKINPLDFYLVMNMAYSDYRDIFDEDVDMYAKFAKDFIMDADAKEGKVYNYFMNIPK